MRKVRVIDPVGYLEFVALQKHATVVITDSAGIQEETTFWGVPCLRQGDVVATEFVQFVIRHQLQLFLYSQLEGFLGATIAGAAMAG